MYLEHFKLEEEPFRLTPDPRYFFTSRQHIEALSCLQYSIEYKRGFGVLIGEAGCGKTTICNVLIEKLEPTTNVALISNTRINERELIYLTLREFGQETELTDKCIMINHLIDYLTRRLAVGVNPVLIIDEAQNLSPKVFEEIQMLANLETKSEKLLQIILMGQPELQEQLNNRRLIQLQQRLSVGIKLRGFSPDETRQYIEFRLKRAGSEKNGIFTSDAIEVIYEETRGIPRLINGICDACLVSAYALSKQNIDGCIAREVIEDRAGLFSYRNQMNGLFVNDIHDIHNRKNGDVKRGGVQGAICSSNDATIIKSHIKDRKGRGDSRGSSVNTKYDDPRLWFRNAFRKCTGSDNNGSAIRRNRNGLKLTPVMDKEDRIRRLLMADITNAGNTEEPEEKMYKGQLNKLKRRTNIVKGDDNIKPHVIETYDPCDILIDNLNIEVGEGGKS